MYILVINGSPRRNGNTEKHVEAFRDGAEAKGHTVEIFPAGRMWLQPCDACESCHGLNYGTCRINDSMTAVIPSLKRAQMVVFASPVHYFGFSGQMQALISRLHCLYKLPAAKYALFLSSEFPDSCDGIISQYHHMVRFFGGKDEGILAVSGEDNGSEETLKYLYEFGMSLEDPRDDFDWDGDDFYITDEGPQF